MVIDPIAVWARMKLKMWPERYWMLALELEETAAAAELLIASDGKYSCLIRDQGCLSIVVDEALVPFIDQRTQIRDRFGPFRIVSTDGELPFNVVGFLRPVLEVLNREGIKAGPQCGADFDHLFIFEKDVDRAQEILHDFIADSKKRCAVAP